MSFSTEPKSINGINNITNLDISELSTKIGRKYKIDNVSFKTTKNLTTLSNASYTIVGNIFF